MTLTVPVSRKVVTPNNAYLVRQELTIWSQATNTFIPWTGIASVRVGFFTDKLGTVGISGLTNITMTEAAAKPGLYYAEIGGNLMSVLTAYVGQTIYQRVTAGPNSDYDTTLAVYVERPRWLQ